MPEIGLFLVASALLTIAPGPDIVYVLTRGIAQGRRAGLAAALGFATGVIFHTALAAFGIAALIRSSEFAFTLVRYAGAAYLIYLGIRTLINDSALQFGSSGSSIALWTVYKQSVIGNALNPKVTLFFLSFLPQFINVNAGPVAPQMVLLGVLFMLQTALIFGAVAFFSGAIGDRLRSKPAIAKRLNSFAGVVFVLLGIRVAWPES
jgi:threonine/homoserine/homoserine lactone efflux protein